MSSVDPGSAAGFASLSLERADDSLSESMLMQVVMSQSPMRPDLPSYRCFLIVRLDTSSLSFEVSAKALCLRVVRPAMRRVSVWFKGGVGEDQGTNVTVELLSASSAFILIYDWCGQNLIIAYVRLPPLLFFFGHSSSPGG